uniref:Secreted protein n=1 Tax=Acrobeloides nanus TaxID=290746 RepID=A0A914CZ73_9BILA
MVIVIISTLSLTILHCFLKKRRRSGWRTPIPQPRNPMPLAQDVLFEPIPVGRPENVPRRVHCDQFKSRALNASKKNDDPMRRR